MATLPRLSSDGRQIKTYAKGANKTFEVRQVFFGITKKAYKFMRQKGVCLVLDVDNNHICFVDEKVDLPKGKEPTGKKFCSSKMGTSYKGLIDPLHLIDGYLTLKPYRIVFSEKAASILGSNIEINQGIKEKADIDTTLEKCRMIWVVCKKGENIKSVKESFPEEYEKLPDDKKDALQNCVIVNTKEENTLMKFEDVDYYSKCIELAEQNGAEEPKDE